MPADVKELVNLRMYWNGCVGGLVYGSVGAYEALLYPFKFFLL